MNKKIRTLKSILVVILINILLDRKRIVAAIKLLNVRRTHRLQTRSLLFPATTPTRVQVRFKRLRQCIFYERTTNIC